MEAYKCWHRILPNPIADDIDVYIQAQNIYEVLAGKLHLPMTLSSFTKLAKISQLASKCQKVSLELLYKKMV